MCPPWVCLNVCIEVGAGEASLRGQWRTFWVWDRGVIVCVCCWGVGGKSVGPAGSLWLQCAPWVSGLEQILCTATAGTWVPTKTELTNTQQHTHIQTHAHSRSTRMIWWEAKHGMWFQKVHYRVKLTWIGKLGWKYLLRGQFTQITKKCIFCSSIKTYTVQNSTHLHCIGVEAEGTIPVSPRIKSVLDYNASIQSQSRN